VVVVRTEASSQGMQRVHAQEHSREAGSLVKRAQAPKSNFILGNYPHPGDYIPLASSNRRLVWSKNTGSQDVCGIQTLRDPYAFTATLFWWVVE